MKFKLDENLPVELAADLRGMGYDVDTVNDEGLRGAADPAVVNAALAAGRILFTLDKGIAQFAALPGAPTCGSSLVSTGHVGTRGRHRICARAPAKSARSGPHQPSDSGRTVPYPISIGRARRARRNCTNYVPAGRPGSAKQNGEPGERQTPESHPGGVEESSLTRLPEGVTKISTPGLAPNSRRLRSNA